MKKFIENHILLISVFVVILIIPSVLKMFFDHPIVMIILAIIIVSYAVSKLKGRTAKSKSDEKQTSNNNKKNFNSVIQKNYAQDSDLVDDLDRKLAERQQKAEEEFLSEGGRLFFICPSTGSIAFLNANQVRKLQAQGQEWIKAELQCLWMDLPGLLTDEEMNMVKQLEKKEEEIERRIGKNVDQDVKMNYIYEQMGGEEVYNWYRDRRVCVPFQEAATKEAAYCYVEKINDYASRRIATIDEQIAYKNKYTTPEQRQLYDERAKELVEMKQKQQKRLEEMRRKKAEEDLQWYMAERRRSVEKANANAEKYKQEKELERSAEAFRRQLDEERHRDKVEQELWNIEWELKNRK